MSLRAVVATRWSLPGVPTRATAARPGRDPRQAHSASRRDIISGVGSCTCSFCGLSAARAAHARGTAGQSWYDDYFAWSMAHTMGGYEAKVASIKHELLGDIQSGVRVLEVGVGTGPNFKYYRPGVRVVGLDPNEAMRDYATAAAAAAGTAGSFEFAVGDVADAPLEHTAFDAAVMTLVLCSVADPALALRGLQQMLLPGARVYVLEHVQSSRNAWLRTQQRVLDPLQQLLADGCHLTRDTRKVIEAAGFARTELQEVELDGLGLLAPHLYGRMVV